MTPKMTPKVAPKMSPKMTPKMNPKNLSLFIYFYKKRYPEIYSSMVDRFIEEVRSGKMSGNYHDYGRLLNY